MTIDVSVMALVGLFVLLGLLSGFLRQVLRLVATVAGAMAAIEFNQVAMEAYPDFLADVPQVRVVFFMTAIFLGVYFVLTIASMLLVRAIHATNPALGALDRLLGGVVGALKGAVLCYFLVSVAVAAEGRLGRRVPFLDTDRSIAVGFVREHPVGNLPALSGWSEWAGDAVHKAREALPLPMEGENGASETGPDANPR